MRCRWVAQDMVSVTLTGLRLATSEGDTAAVAGAATGLENEFTSSIASWTGHGSGCLRTAGPPKRYSTSAEQGSGLLRICCR